MNAFTFYAPTYFAFGAGKAKEVGHYIKRFGGKKVLFHYGKGSIQKSGLYDEIVAALQKMQIPFVTLGGVQPNPRSGLVYEGISICKKEKIDFILAVGGGSVIDSAKAIAAGTLYDGDFWDFYSGKPVEQALPVGTVLTIAAAGSEGSPGSVITKEEGMLKRSAGGEALRPVFSILDPTLTMTLPPYQTAAGITDICVHVLERYFSNTKDVEITDRLCEAVLKTMLIEGKKVIENPQDAQARANVMWAGMVAHNDLCGVGREQDWSTHNIEHEISAKYDVAHGAGLAVISPAWMKYVMPKNITKFVSFATRVFGCELQLDHPERTAMEGIARWEQFLREIGMPVRLKELEIPLEDCKQLVDHMGLSKQDTIGSFVLLGPEDILEIYRLAE